MNVIKSFYHLYQFCRDRVLLKKILLRKFGQGKFIPGNIDSRKVSANKNRRNSEFFNLCTKVASIVCFPALLLL